MFYEQRFHIKESIRNRLRPCMYAAEAEPPVTEPKPPSVEQLMALRAEWEQTPAMDAWLRTAYWGNIRMRWNTHSNAIEGNTLTYQETALLLIFGQTKGSHQIREYDEMRGHDMAIEHLNDLIDNDRPLNEADLRGLHKLMLVKDYTAPARTPEGKPGQRTIRVGQYKTEPNAVLQPDGTLYAFAAPEKTPALMQAYMQRLQTGIEDCRLNNEKDIALFMAETHHEFIRIHPFDDGNGRMGRLLLNYAVQSCGYPSLIIPVEKRQTYIQYLHQADTGDIIPLRDFLAARLAEGLTFGIAVKHKKCEPSWKNQEGDPDMRPINGFSASDTLFTLAGA